MKTNQTFEDYLSNQIVQTDYLQFGINLFCTAISSLILIWAYRHLGRSRGNKTIFSVNFLIVSLTTMIVISIIKSSLALSLGLVGALSIVRYRTAIKDPEELSFLFISVAIGLGFGANEKFITCLGVIFVVLFYWLVRRNQRTEFKPKNFYVRIKSNQVSQNLQFFEMIFKDLNVEAELKRSFSNPDFQEIVYQTTFSNSEQIPLLIQNIRTKMNTAEINIYEYTEFVE